MTTHDQHTEATRSAATVAPPISQTEERNERVVPTAHDALPYAPSGAPTQSATGGSETTDVVGKTMGPTLFADDELAGLRARWDRVQAGFVDDPRDCVHKADGLVSDVVEQLTTGFTEARSRLEEHWARGEEASTEDLRVALKGYREFFERLLAV